MFFNHLFFFAVPELINIVMRFLTGMVTAKILGPEKLGVVGAVALIFMYSTLLQLGVVDGMGLKIYALKANNKSTPVIKAFFSTAYIFVNGILLIASILLCSYLYYFKKLENILWLGIMVNIAISFLYQFFNFTVGHARFDYQYKKVGNITGAGYIIRALLTIVLTYLYQLKGFFISLLIGYIFVDIYGWFVVRPKFSKIFRPKMVKEMLVLGFPMIVIGSLFTVFHSIDRWFIIKCINIKQLGYYSIIMTLSGFLLIGVIKAVSLLTQYSREYYAKTKNINHIIYGYFQFSVFFIIINIFLIFFAKEGMFYLFKYYLLKYQSSYKIASPVLISTFFIAMFHIAGTFFVIINKKRYTIVSLLTALPCAVLFNWISLKMDGTVYGIAVATLLSVVVLYLLVLIFLKKYFSIGNINAIIYFVSFISSLIFIFSVNYLVVHSFDNILWECLKISFYNFVLYFTFGAVFFLIAIKVRKNTELGLIVKK